MTDRRPPSRRSSPLRARGFTLIELMVSISIGLFLVAGLLTLVQAMRRTFNNQSGLSVLQDNERMAMQLITDVVQSTGYFTSPLTNTAAASFPVVTYPSAAFTYAGEALVGTGTWGVANHVITARYQTTGTDNVINCTGNSSAIPARFTNQFYISIVGGVSYLSCKFWLNNSAQPTTVALIPGVTNLQIYYGVTTGAGSATNSIDTYLDAPAVTAGNYWSQVRSIQITLSFNNPMCTPTQCQPGQTNQTINFTRVITVMNKTGVTTT